LKFDFNVSHQGDYSVIGAESGTMVGTDIMKLEAPSKYIQLNLYIKGTQGNLQMCSLLAVVLYIQVKIICTIH